MIKAVRDLKQLIQKHSEIQNFIHMKTHLSYYSAALVVLFLLSYMPICAIQEPFLNALLKHTQTLNALQKPANQIESCEVIALAEN